jgi:hypothetical protein
VDILANQRIAFSQRSALNDIFELRPRVTLDGRTYNEARRKLISQNPYMPVPPDATQKEDEKIINGTLDEALILCLSEAWDIIPMWSYYADAHKGFVLGFNATHDFFSPFSMRAVQYSTDFPEVNYLIGFGEAIFNKFEQWEHEREWRCFRLAGYGGDSYSHPDGVTDVFLYALPPDAIQEIVLGHRMEDANKEEILSYVSTAAYKRVEVYQAVPDKYAWRLERRRIVA